MEIIQWRMENDLVEDDEGEYDDDDESDDEQDMPKEQTRLTETTAGESTGMPRIRSMNQLMSVRDRVLEKQQARLAARCQRRAST
jgi:hypothetical protein